MSSTTIQDPSLSPTDLLFRNSTADPASPLPAPSALLVFAHPDDETIALGGRLARFPHATLLQTTDGAPANAADSTAHGFPTVDAYREARQRELSAALAMAGFPSSHVDRGTIPDQQASRHLVPLTRRILDALHRLAPAVAFTHPYEGGHPDHDATAFAVHAAIALLPRRPLLLESTFYHAGPHGIETGTFLPAPSNTPTVRPLNPAQQQQKQAMLACFTTQQQTLAQFVTTTETFRLAPIYDFTRPPHPGPLFYESFPWGMRSADFCALATQALHDLGLPPTPEAAS